MPHPVIYPALRPLLFRLDPERAHRLAIDALHKLPARLPPARHGPLSIHVAGIDFPNPVGLAAGFDKDAEVPGALARLGFGFVEVGSITPRPQEGNPRPRLFRLEEDLAVINRMGFNNKGLDAAHARMTALRTDENGSGSKIVVGVNVGANKDSADKVADFVAGLTRMAAVASYLTINVSSPNTPGLRDLQGDKALETLLSAVAAARADDWPPIFLKVAPDLDVEAPARIAEAVMHHRIDAIIVSNTTVTRPALQSRHAHEAGGLSGAPLRDLALDSLRRFYQATGGRVPLVGVGGIASAEDAWTRIRAGASLVQVYSAMVYEGPLIARTICKGLERLMREHGFASIADAVGSE